MLFIGIDIGTTSVCGLAFDLISRKFNVVTSYNKANLISSNTWEKIQDPEQILSVVEGILKEFCDKYDKISGIGITGQMHGILYTDDNGNAVSPLYTWEDKRGNQIYRGGMSYARFLSGLTLYQVASGFGLVTHYYNLMNGLLPHGATRLCTIMDYIVMKLTGKRSPLIDPTNAASLGIFDLTVLSFDQKALLKADINPDILPGIGPSGSFVGFYKGDIPVYSAIGDNQASFLGSGARIDKSILVNIGTGSQISMYSDAPVENGSFDIRPFPGGGYLLVGAVLYGGKSLSLLKSFFEQTIDLFVPNCTDKIKFYDSLNLLDRALLSDHSGLKVEPLFSGTRKNPELKGSINLISDTNFTPEKLMAGFLKGICVELANFFDYLPVQKQHVFEYLTGSGNAVRQNPILREMLEITFGKKLYIPVHTEEAAFGACICALKGGGHISDFNETEDMIEYIST